MDSGNDNSLTLEESINSSFKILESFYDSNDIDDCIEQTEQYAKHDIYHSAMKSILAIFKSAMTLNQEDIEKATKSAVKTAELCDKYRRRGIFEDFLKILRTPDYSNYTEIEIHAELTFAMIMAYSAMLGLVNSHSIFDFFRIINRLRLSKNAYKECRQMFQKRVNWESEISRVNFEAGISVERGCRHLIISFLPPTILKLVNFLGYRGIRKIAYRELNKTTFELKGVYCKMSETVLLLYHLYVESICCVGQKESKVSDNILRRGLKTHPHSIAYNLFRAKSKQITGNIDIAIKEFKHLMIPKIKIFHKVSHFELMMTYALRSDWDQCIKYSRLLRRLTLHSPPLFTYCEAVFRYLKSVETNNQKQRERANQLFKIVPTLRTLYLGLSPTFESMAIEYSKKYFDNNEFLFLPDLDMLYIWNTFLIIESNNPLIDKLMKRIEKELKTYSKNSEDFDCYLTAIFYKGLFFRLKGKLNEAKKLLEQILNEKSRIQEMDSLVPQALMELGFIEMLLNNYTESKMLFDQVLNNYSGYLTEFVVQIRIHTALRGMGFNTDSEDVVEAEIVEEYSDIMAEVNELDDNNNRHQLLRL